MFHTLLTADLPSVEKSGAAPGDDDFARTHDRVSFGSAHLLHLLHESFRSAGVRDVAYIRIDDEVVYADEDGGTADEMDDLLERAAKGGFLARPYFRIEMALDHVEDGVRHVILTTLRTAVPAGEPEMTIEVASRPLDAMFQQQETTSAYATRMRALAAQRGKLLADLSRVQVLRDRLHGTLRDAFRDASLTAGDVRMWVVRPSTEQLGALDGFSLPGDGHGLAYALAPDGRPPGWADVFLRLYDDAGLVLRHLMLLEGVMTDGHLREPWLIVVDVDGTRLFDGTKARWFEEWPWRAKFALDTSGPTVRVVLNR